MNANTRLGSKTAVSQCLALLPFSACEQAQDPCDAIPPGHVPISAAECGWDTLDLEQVHQVAKGELSVPGLPPNGPFAKSGDLPLLKVGPLTSLEFCHQCSSVCDCWIYSRGCIDSPAANRSMPLDYRKDKRLAVQPCDNPEGVPAGHVMACRQGQCVWEIGSNTRSATDGRSTDGEQKR